MLVKLLWALIGVQSDDFLCPVTSPIPALPQLIPTPMTYEPSTSGYTFVTKNITNIDDEIESVKFGVVDYFTTRDIDANNYSVKVWMYKWTNVELHQHLSAGYTARINVSPDNWWLIKYIEHE